MPDQPLVPVIDLAKWQGRVDFHRMASTGVVGVIIKLLNGQALDPNAERYIGDAHDAGMIVGGYGFCNPKADRSGTDQAARLVALAHKLGALDIPPMLDIENYLSEPGGYPVLTGIHLQAWLTAFVDRAEVDCGFPPIVYSNAAYFNSQGMVAGTMARCSLIVARYPWYFPGQPKPPVGAALWEDWLFANTAKRPQVPSGWAGWSGWQFAAGFDEVGAAYGVESRDLDLDLIKPDAWERWLRQTGHLPQASTVETSPIIVTSPQEADMPAIVTHEDNYTDPAGTVHAPGQVKWEYIGGERVHISFEYWNGLGAPAGNPRPIAEILTVQERQAPTSAPPSPIPLTGTATVTVDLHPV